MQTFRLEKWDLPSRLAALFQTPSVTLLCFLVAVVNKSMIAWIYTDLEGDKSIYLLYAQSILDGHGGLEPIGFHEDGMQYVYSQAFFSPLYSLLATPFLALTGSYLASSFCLDVLSWCLFFSGLYKLAAAVINEKWVASILVLCSGFFLYPHELQSAPKDTLAIGLLMWTIYGFLRFIHRPPLLGRTFLLGLGFCGLALVKFLYMPVAGMLLVLLGFLCLRNKSGPHTRHFVILLVLCAILVGGFLWWDYRLQEFPSPVPLSARANEFVKGIFPGNLLQTYPFISSSLLNTNFWSVQLQDIFHLRPATLLALFQVLDLFLLSGLVILLRWILKKRNEPLVMGLLVGGLLLLMLAFMSIRYQGVNYPGSDRSWTYVQDPRSYLFLIVLLQIVLFFFIFKGRPALNLFRNFLLLLFLIECLHGAYFTTKQVLSSKEIKQQVAGGSAVKRITNSILDLEKESGKMTTVSTEDAHLRRYLVLHRIPVKQFRGQPCLEPTQQPSYPLLFVLFERDSAILHCKEGKLTTSELVSPFVLRFYEGQNKP